MDSTDQARWCSMMAAILDTTPRAMLGGRAATDPLRGWRRVKEDPRADVNDDGACNASDTTPFNNKLSTWTEASPTVAQAFSDADSPFGFQGRCPWTPASSPPAGTLRAPPQDRTLASTLITAGT